MIVAVLSGFVLALVAPWIHRVARAYSGWVLGLLPAGLFLYFLSLAPDVAHGKPLATSFAWFPSLGIDLSFYADGLSLTFALLISGIGFLVTVYSGGYLHGHPLLGRWYAYLLAFMASMLGVVLSENLIALFVFWELTSLTSYLLIGFNSDEEESRDAALQALLVTGLGGLALLFGSVLLQTITGTYSLMEVVHQGEAVRESTLYLPILLLVLAGAFTKSAQVPFHFWLPNAMAAPTPASAYLHSSTMVKAGLYLLARLSPVLGGPTPWVVLVTGFGAATMLTGAYLAIQQNVLKKLLAYSTVSALGTIMMLIGLNNERAAQAAIVFLVAHAFYKAALFLVAGAIDHGTGERDVTKLSGLFKAMPYTAVGAGIAGLSMSGIPLLFGFVGKELAYESTLHAGNWAAVLTAFIVVSSMFFLVVATCVAYKPFYGQHVKTPKHPHEAPLSMWLGPVALGLCSLGFGIMPGWLDGVLGSAAHAIVESHHKVHLALWHGWNLALGLSALTVAGGLLFYAFRLPVTGVLAPIRKLAQLAGPERWYHWTLDGMKSTAKVQTALLQNGYLRYYLIFIMLVAVGLTGTTLLRHFNAESGPEALGQVFAHQIEEAWEHLRFYEIGLAGVLVFAIAAAVHSQTRLAAIAALGVVGYGIAVIFVLYGAPDLAMTQLVIETLTVVLFVLVFYHLPQFAIYTSKAERGRDLVLAISVGVLMGTLVLVAVDSAHHPSISEYFLENSYSLAHGRNIVNVILVDFRGIDTMGEITVLGVAGVGAYSLLKLRLSKRALKKAEKESA